MQFGKHLDVFSLLRINVKFLILTSGDFWDHKISNSRDFKNSYHGTISIFCTRRGVDSSQTKI